MAEKYYVEVDENGSYWYAWPGEARKLHRLDGPAIEYSAGSRAWYQNGQLHRLGGPALEYADGSREWYQNGQRHRVDGRQLYMQVATEPGIKTTYCIGRMAQQLNTVMTVSLGLLTAKS